MVTSIDDVKCFFTRVSRCEHFAPTAAEGQLPIKVLLTGPYGMFRTVRNVFIQTIKIVFEDLLGFAAEASEE